MEGKRFLGAKLETLTAAGVILAPSLITLCVVAAMLYAMNAKLVRIQASVDANLEVIEAITEQAAANGAALEANGVALEKLGAAIDELGAEIKNLLLTLRELNDALSDDTERAR